MMNINNLKTFCLVVEEGNISQVARMSYVSQPAITRQIKQLEEHYGAELFDRNEGKLVLSETGKILYPRIKELLYFYNQIDDEIQIFLAKKTKTLNIGASLTIGEYLLPLMIKAFHEEYPDVNFNVTIGNTPQMIESLYNDNIEIALIESYMHREDLIKHKFAEDELILVTHPSHHFQYKESVHLKDLLNEKILWRESESGMRNLVESFFNDHNLLPLINNSMELGSMQAIKSAVEADLGISILPKITVFKELEYNILSEVKVLELNIKRDFWVFQKNRRFISPEETAFRDFTLNYNIVYDN